MLFSGVGGRVIFLILRLFPFVNVLHLPVYLENGLGAQAPEKAREDL